VRVKHYPWLGGIAIFLRNSVWYVEVPRPIMRFYNKECPVTKMELKPTAHECADRVATEAARRADIASPAETYKEVYGEIYKYLTKEHPQDN
jgi:hypothetical protein